ncbi:MAG: CBS domain-containing protein [Chitinophagales bacterium]
MTAKELISGVIPPLKNSDSGLKAIEWMQEFSVHHLPVIDKGEFLGLLSEEDILDLSDPSEAIGKHKFSLHKPFVKEGDHIFEVIKIAAQLQLSIIPVIDEHNHYQGAISLESLINRLASFSSIEDPGGILVLEMNKNDYSLTEISRIVESNNAQILSSMITSHRDSTKIEVTLKLNVSDMKHVISTFERFEYKVTASFQESDYFEHLKDHYDALMNYLNV